MSDVKRHEKGSEPQHFLHRKNKYPTKKTITTKRALVTLKSNRSTTNENRHIEEINLNA